MKFYTRKNENEKAQDIFLVSEVVWKMIIDACLIYEKRDKKKDIDWKIELMAGSHIRIFFYLLELLMMNLDLQIWKKDKHSKKTA